MQLQFFKQNKPLGRECRFSFIDGYIYTVGMNANFNKTLGNLHLFNAFNLNAFYEMGFKIVVNATMNVILTQT